MLHDQETVLLQGHIIDSLILAKVLDTILMMGGTFDLQDMQIGKTREEPSRGYLPHPVPLDEFMKSGGSAKCLTLALN